MGGSEPGSAQLCQDCKDAHPYVLKKFLMRMQTQFPDDFYQKGIEKLNANWQPKTVLEDGLYHCVSRQTRFRDPTGKAEEFVEKLTNARQLGVKDINAGPDLVDELEYHFDEKAFRCHDAEGPDMICKKCIRAVSEHSDKEGTEDLKDYFTDGKTLKKEVLDAANEQAT
ncbi:hypothetical protein J4E89_003000 [Alternaria sp. Ai002NY15]|nr:hypothetical protein J4E89_003000 [Alternaria sp. Ai002NY15]